MIQYSEIKSIRLKQEALQKEINRNVVSIDQTVFRKTAAEKLALANAKLKYKNSLKKSSK